MADGPDPAVRSAGPHAATAPSAAPRNRRVVSGIRVALWRPATGLWATARARRRPSVPSLWDVSTRAVLSGAVRVLRFQYVHRGDLAGRATGRFRRAGDRGDHLRPAGAGGIRCPRPAHRDGLFWGRYAHSAAGYRSRADACRSACGVWAATRCRGDNRGEPRYGWAAGGVTRISFGMQSAVPHVLATLDRTHDPERVALVVAAAHSAGLAVSVDLIFGTPGESLADWQRSLDAALACQPEHISAYSLIVEEGTALARRIRRGELAAPTDDMQADMYELADQRFAAAGFEWYEISNWARDASHRSRHNLGYWRGDDWWGIGPGAHSHIGGVRWWNVKHPAVYAERITAGVSPADGRETLDPQTREVERVMLGVRVRAGMALASLSHSARLLVAEFIAEELIDAQAALAGELTLTRRGRLLADAVVRRLLEASDADG